MPKLPTAPLVDAAAAEVVLVYPKLDPYAPHIAEDSQQDRGV